MHGLVFEKVEGPVGMELDETLGELEGVDDRVFGYLREWVVWFGNWREWTLDTLRRLFEDR